MTDPDGTEDDVLEHSEVLDEDEMGVDPLEEAIDPPDGGQAADAHGTATTEQGDGLPLDDRLERERADFGDE